MFLYRRGIFIIDRYILYSSYDFRFTPRTQRFCTDVVYLLLTGTFCVRLMTFVSPLGFNVSVQTWYIYYWHVHFVFVLWLSFHPQYSMFLYKRGIFIIDRYILYSSYDFRFTPRTQCFCTDVVYLLLTGTFCIRLMTFVSPLGLNVSVETWYIYYWQVHFVNNVITIKTKAPLFLVYVTLVFFMAWRSYIGPLVFLLAIQWSTRKMTKGQAMIFKTLHIYNQDWATRTTLKKT